MITATPSRSAIATIPSWARVDLAWVVNHEDVVYLDTGLLRIAPMEEGIGGRLTEPAFSSYTDYLLRSFPICYVNRSDDFVEQVIGGWWEYKKTI
jgi:hypothetical protein